MNPRLLVAAIFFVSTFALPAQGVGFRDLSFTNTTGQGSSSIPVRLYYPASGSGQNAPLTPPPPGGYPVVVFLHGLFQIGRSYSALGSHLAAHGYVAVMNDTGQFSPTLQALDGAALFHALVTTNAQPGSFLQGALDMTNAGLCGHSVGGGNTVTVLATNPGYKAGLCYAPIYPGASTTSQVDVPLGIIQAEGDLVLAWWLTGLSMFNAADNFTGLKFFYLFDLSGGHNNVPGLFVLTSADQQVWDRSRRVMTGFFDRYLRDEVAGLDEAIGASALAEPRLTSIDVEIEAPDLWLTGQPTLGQTVQITMSSEPGFVLYLAAAATSAPVATQFGNLLLDLPTAILAFTNVAGPSRVATVPLAIPNSGQLVGTQIPFQGLGLDNMGSYGFTGATTLVVSN